LHTPATPSSSLPAATPRPAVAHPFAILLVAALLAGASPVFGAGAIEPWTGGAAPPLVLDDLDDRVSKYRGVRGYPTTFVVGADHRIVMVAVGEIDRTEPGIVARRCALAGPATSRAALGR
jgi:hypothetical protein